MTTDDEQRKKNVSFLGDEHSATFLIKHSCELNHQTSIGRETPLHLLSSLKPKQSSAATLTGACRLTELLLEYGADVNQKDAQGNTCLHRAILADNIEVFRILLKVPNLLLEETNRDGHVPFWLALQQAEQMSKSIEH